MTETKSENRKAAELKVSAHSTCSALHLSPDFLAAGLEETNERNSTES